MATNDDFGELLIEALEEAVAYREGRRPGLRVTRYEITARGAAVWPPPSYDAERVRRVRARRRMERRFGCWKSRRTIRVRFWSASGLNPRAKQSRTEDA